MKKLFIILTILVMAVSVNAANLKWDGVGQCLGYNVYYTDGAEEFRYNAKERPEVIDIDKTLNLHPGKTYVFYVTAYDNFGESGKSNTAEYITSATYTPPDNNMPEEVTVPAKVNVLEILQTIVDTMTENQ